MTSVAFSEWNDISWSGARNNEEQSDSSWRKHPIISRSGSLSNTITRLSRPITVYQTVSQSA